MFASGKLPFLVQRPQKKGFVVLMMTNLFAVAPRPLIIIPTRKIIRGLRGFYKNMLKKVA